jgi:phage shock protein C
VQPWAGEIRHSDMELKRRIYRSRHDRMLAGVAGGLADYLDVDPAIVRLLWLAGFVTTGPLAVFAYLACAVVIPREADVTLV